MMSLSGIALGVVYDTYRVVCGQLRASRWILSLLDLLYWVFATVFVFRVLYYSNQGELRVFVFFGLILGTLFYFWIISSITVRFVVWLIKVIKALIRFVLRCVHIFIIIPLRVFHRLLIILLGFVTAIAIFIYRIVLQMFRPLVLLIWKLLKYLYTLVKAPAWFRSGIDRIRKWWKRDV
jgi:spore cortex biosynthesis protein YabQ